MKRRAEGDGNSSKRASKHRAQLPTSNTGDECSESGAASSVDVVSAQATQAERKPAARKRPPASAKSIDSKPKNFAGRVMRILEEGLLPDMLFWAGDGKAVALIPKELKKRAKEIQETFHVKDYSALIRNFNRWGFRRVSFYSDSIPAGAVTYQNSLFKRDQPHLVKHMRIDSDVQNVFEHHQHLGDESQQSPTAAASAPRGSDQQYTASAQPITSGGGLNSAVPLNQQQASHQQQQQQLTSMLSGNAGAGQSNEAGKRLLTNLLSSLANQGTNSQSNGQASISQPPLVSQIKQLCQQLAQQPATAESLSSIVAALQVLQMLGGHDNNNQQPGQQQSPQFRNTFGNVLSGQQSPQSSNTFGKIMSNTGGQPSLQQQQPSNQIINIQSLLNNSNSHPQQSMRREPGISSSFLPSVNEQQNQRAASYFPQNISQSQSQTNAARPFVSAQDILRQQQQSAQNYPQNNRGGQRPQPPSQQPPQEENPLLDLIRMALQQRGNGNGR